MRPISVTQNGIGSSEWKLVNWHIAPINLGIAVAVTGMANYTVEYTLDDVLLVAAPTVFSLPGLSGLTVDAYAGLSSPVAYIRLTVTGGAGSATMTYLQAGIAGN